MRSPLNREAWRDALWWIRSQHPGIDLIYASAILRRSWLATRQHVVAVVGSYGKTTTTRAVRAALGQPESSWAEANPNTLGEVAWSLLREPIKQRHVVVEAGIAAPGQMAHYTGILRPHTTIVTCLGHEHLRAFGSMSALRNEKADAVRCLPAQGTAILNADDPHVRWMATQTAAQVVWFGASSECDVWAGDIRLDWPHGMRFRLHAGGQSCELRTRLFGRHFVYSLLAATAAGLGAGQPLDAIATRLAQLRPTRCRLQVVPLPSGATLIRDEYKATPDTVHEALDLLRQSPASRRIVVIGDLDNLPTLPVEPWYEKIGESIGACADLVLVVGSSLSNYLPGFRAAGLSDEQILEADDVHQAIRMLRGEVRNGDVVLLKGQENDRLSRIALALAGREVKCARTTCTAYLQFCDECPLLGCAALN